MGCLLRLEIELKGTSVSATFIANIKREAKQRAKAESRPHTELLEELAREAGFTNWFELQHAGAAVEPPGLRVDPPLRRGFDSTPNEHRSKRELDRWWDRPYALTCPDGRFEVRCLDGGAWDRSTWYGVADTLADAEKLATEKLARWLEYRSRPTALFQRSGKFSVILMAQRPDGKDQVLKADCTAEDAAEFISEFCGRESST